MYQFSRAIYRELAPYIAAPGAGGITRRPAAGKSNHEQVLRACEAAIERLATDRHYFARPARTLFWDIRMYFPMSAQARVHQGRRPLHGPRAALPGGEPAGGVRGGERRAAAVPGDDPQGRGVPADAAGAQRVLPVPPASRGHREQRAAGRLKLRLRDRVISIRRASARRPAVSVKAVLRFGPPCPTTIVGVVDRRRPH